MQLYASLSTKHTLKPIIRLSDTQGQEQGTQVQLNRGAQQQFSEEYLFGRRFEI